MATRALSIGAMVLAAMADGTFLRIAQDPRAQFGDDTTRNGRRLGASLMPERTVDENNYTEDVVRYRTMVANHGTRYSAPQYKKGELIGTVKVSLFNSDIGRDIKGKDLDAIKRLLGRQQNAQAIATTNRLLDRLIVRALVDINEINIWEAIVEGVAHLRGNNGYTEDVAYPNPAGHRVTAGGDWTDPDYDPMLDLLAAKTLYSGKGLGPSRAFAGEPVVNTLLSHPLIIARGVLVAGQVPSALDLPALNNILTRNGLPAIEQYDAVAHTETGPRPFLARDAFVMTAETENSEVIADQDDADQEEVEGTIGYVAMGTPHNREDAGRAVRAVYDDAKGGGVKMEGWQECAPVVTDPEAIFAIRGITTGA